jgi:hypothetical protein
MMSQPQLSDEVRDWYWQLLERFRFGYAFYRNFSTELLGEFVVLGYKLISLFGCKQLAMARHWRDAYFRCGDMIVRYWVEFAPEPKRELRRRIEELERRLNDELFSIRVSFPFFDTIIGMGEQPRIGSVLGTYRIQRIELSYEPVRSKVTIRLKWHSTSAKVFPIEYVAVDFSSPSTYEINYNVTRSREYDELAIAILTDIYNNRGMLINYINRAHDFLAQLVKGLTTYLLY